MRAGIFGEINAQPDMTVVAEATDGEQEIARFPGSSSCHPDGW
jgi:hypothetical protein